MLQHFALRQESCCKDVERAFGVLQARFEIMKRPPRYWSIDNMATIMTACIILHIMIVEDERELDLPYDYHIPPNVVVAPILEHTEQTFEMFANILLINVFIILISY